MHKSKNCLYALFDTTTANLTHWSLASSDSAYVLKVLPLVQIPLKFLRPYCFGEFEISLPPVDVSQTPCYNIDEVVSYNFNKIRGFDWSCVSIPESKADALAPLGLPVDQVEELVKSAQRSINLETSVR